MRLFLPPSETKRAPARGTPVRLDALSFPELADSREEALEAIASASEHDDAAARFGVSEKLLPLVRANASWRTAPAAAAASVYEGVLYDALGYEDLSPAAKRRAHAQVRVFSAAFGVLGLTDRIPAYRASGTLKTPALGSPLATWWSRHLAEPLAEDCSGGLVVDARSGTYAGMFKPEPSQWVGLDVVQRRGDRLAVVSHFAKHTRGQAVRALLESGERLGSAQALRDWAKSQFAPRGWEVRLGEAHRSKPRSLTLVLPEDHSFAQS
ncbi:YaaA family protein [Arthrobacter sp. UM1]|uniref:YaaA family protein n=1 Tax=Arthrobacter sp. UM1 TaxID=2766776 RepID=UPI001CF62C35|nr:peroxide stress protein YaaA [Arthrobacter sp. UM1]MCB4207348.1 peroxide stress protein YaaA [Arthrobacter sp. UM1]